MEGARELYNLFYYVGNIKDNTCNLKQIARVSGYSEYAYQFENIVFLLHEHARGKTFSIWIYEEPEITDYINEEHLEVYGITGGNAGWTETYGWTKTGIWIDYIEKYFNSLREFKKHNLNKKLGQNAKLKDQEKEYEKQKIGKFNMLFELK